MGANHIVSPVLELTCLRRVMNQEVEVMGQTIRIGEEIPTFTIINMELGMNKDQSKMYKRAYTSLRPSLQLGGFEDTGIPHVNAME